MKKPFVAEIVKDSKLLLREVVSVCGDFPQKLKFILTERLYELAMDGLLRAQDAARLGDKRAAEQHPHLKKLIEHNDKLQALLDVAFELHCFKSAGQYENLLRLACKVGAQAGGWLSRVEGKINALPIRQSPEASSLPGRPGALSTEPTPSGVNP